MIQKYFKSFQDGFMISADIKRMVAFSRINLLDQMRLRRWDRAMRFFAETC